MADVGQHINYSALELNNSKNKKYKMDYQKDLESPYQLEKDEREGFLKKVYSLITLMLCVTFGMCIIASTWTPFQEWCLTWYNIVIALVLLLTCGIASCFLSRAIPWNYLCLLGFTLGMGFLLSSLTAALNDTQAVLYAIAFTIIVSVGLTVYTFIAGRRAVVWAFFVILFGLCLCEFFYCALWVTRSDWAFSAYCAGAAMVYGGYLVIHTYILKSSDNVDDYVIAAIMIYLDIIKIFMYILMIFGSKK